LSSFHSIGTPFTELLRVDSTNNYAMGLARAGMAHHGHAVFAHEQTKGRGQRSREWTSQSGKNIALSLVIEPAGLPSQMFLLSMAVANGTLTFLNQFMADEGRIKWPNDLYWRDRKAGGILIENIWVGNEWKFAIVGIGLNINQTDFGELGTRAVSLKQISGRDFVPIELAQDLCNYIQKQYNLLMDRRSEVIAQYRAQLYKLNEKVRLKKGARSFEGIVRNVTEDGRLVVETATEESFEVGEIEWLMNG